ESGSYDASCSRRAPSEKLTNAKTSASHVLARPRLQSDGVRNAVRYRVVAEVPSTSRASLPLPGSPIVLGLLRLVRPRRGGSVHGDWRQPLAHPRPDRRVADCVALRSWQSPSSHSTLYAAGIGAT